MSICPTAITHRVLGLCCKVDLYLRTSRAGDIRNCSPRIAVRSVHFWGGSMGFVDEWGALVAKSSVFVGSLCFLPRFAYFCLSYSCCLVWKGFRSPGCSYFSVWSADALALPLLVWAHCITATVRTLDPMGGKQCFLFRQYITK